MICTNGRNLYALLTGPRLWHHHLLVCSRARTNYGPGSVDRLRQREWGASYRDTFEDQTLG